MCNKSETISKLAVALVKFNMEVKIIEKDAKNPHFKNDYASLDTIIDEVRPLLAKQGLVIMQFPGGDGEKFTLRSMLIHESGEWIESEPITLRPVKNDPQGIGSCSTYARRYSLSAMLSLNTGEDDDGNHATQPSKSYEQPKQYTQPNTPSTQQTTDTSNPAQSSGISAAQIKYAHTLKSKKKVSEDDFKRMVAEHGNESLSDLTAKQAREFINFLTAIADPA